MVIKYYYDIRLFKFHSNVSDKTLHGYNTHSYSRAQISKVLVLTELTHEICYPNGYRCLETGVRKYLIERQVLR